MPVVRNKTRSKAVMWGTQIPPYYFGLLPDIIRNTGEAFIKSLASDTAKEIKHRIVTQSYKHVPLTSNYKRWKKKKGYDPRILIRTRFLLDNIGSFKDSVNKAGIIYTVGVKDIGYPDGKRLQTIARYLEYGTSRMPARPIFRTLQREISAKIHTHVLRLVRMLNLEFAKKMPPVQIEQMLARILKTGDTELVQQRRVAIQGRFRGVK